MQPEKHFPLALEGTVGMHTREIGENLFLIDLEVGGFKGIAAAYVLKGTMSVIVETGPASSTGNLLLGLSELSVKPRQVDYVAISHVHLDHGGGAGTLLKWLPNAKVIVHPRGIEHLVNPGKLWGTVQTCSWECGRDLWCTRACSRK